MLYKKFPCKLNAPITKYDLLHDIRAFNIHFFMSTPIIILALRKFNFKVVSFLLSHNLVFLVPRPYNESYLACAYQIWFCHDWLIYIRVVFDWKLTTNQNRSITINPIKNYFQKSQDCLLF